MEAAACPGTPAAATARHHLLADHRSPSGSPSPPGPMLARVRYAARRRGSLRRRKLAAPGPLIQWLPPPPGPPAGDG
jgi:hypothetical protein